MINPTLQDIGKSVIYRDSCGETEYGIITSFNDKFVFVRYDSQHREAPGQATDRDNLRWSNVTATLIDKCKI